MCDVGYPADSHAWWFDCISKCSTYPLYIKNKSRKMMHLCTRGEPKTLNLLTALVNDQRHWLVTCVIGLLRFGRLSSDADPDERCASVFLTRLCCKTTICGLRVKCFGVAIACKLCLATNKALKSVKYRCFAREWGRCISTGSSPSCIRRRAWRLFSASTGMKSKRNREEYSIVGQRPGRLACVSTLKFSGQRSISSFGRHRSQVQGNARAHDVDGQRGDVRHVHTSSAVLRIRLFSHGG